MEKKGKENKEKLQTSIKNKKFPHVFLFFSILFSTLKFYIFLLLPESPKRQFQAGSHMQRINRPTKGKPKFYINEEKRL